MSKSQSQRIRRKLWIRRIAGTLVLLFSIPTLRKANGAQVKQIKIPSKFDWEPVDITEDFHGEGLSSPGAPTNSVILHIHGGGGVLCLNNSSRSMIGYLTLASSLRALLPDFRIAPEHPYPAGLDDCLSPVFACMMMHHFIGDHSLEDPIYRQ